jgi:hypothetical protein
VVHVSEQDDQRLAPFRARVATHALRGLGLVFSDPAKAVEEFREMDAQRAEFERVAAFLRLMQSLERP